MVKVQEIDPEMVVLIQRITETAVIKARIEDGKMKAYMSLREAEETYGAINVAAWRKAGLIQCLKDGERNAKIRIDRYKIASVAAASQRGFARPTKKVKK